ncbi:uncharacterized protein METZ01_LOCUS195240 [marine metagenome]|uniref:Glycosyl hydrolase-like 10 domain-containing protein n=1 Tax=marine metagenome TaxID=408172 RepID=A0A382DV48_9ZZZZ
MSIFYPSLLVAGEDEKVSPLYDRYLWVIRDVLKSKRSIDDMVSFAIEKNINHLFVQVRGRGDSFYESQFTSRSQILSEGEFDPLAYLLDTANGKGINIHAWVNVYFLWSSKSLPKDERHILHMQQQWLDTTEEWPVDVGKQLEMVAVNNSNEGLFLSPNHPDVNEYLIKVFRELITNYDIDGLHLDYIRYQDAEYGRNPYAIARFKSESGNDPGPWFLEMERSTIASPRLIANMKRWNNFKRKAVTSLVKDTRALVDEVRPDCIISAAVKPNLYVARERYFQEWNVWLAAGYMDWVVPMNYSPKMREFARNIDVINDNFPKKYREKIIMGIALHNQTPSKASEKIKISRLRQFPRVSIFSYKIMIKDHRYSAVFDEENH